MRTPGFDPKTVHVRHVWTKWNWDRFSSEYFGVPLSVIPPTLHTHLHLHAGRTGKAWEPSEKLHWTEFLHFCTKTRAQDNKQSSWSGDVAVRCRTRTNCVSAGTFSSHFQCFAIPRVYLAQPQTLFRPNAQRNPWRKTLLKAGQEIPHTLLQNEKHQSGYEPDESTPHTTTMLSSHLFLGLSHGVLFSSLPARTMYAFLTLPMHGTSTTRFN